jgi:hypothetical protein
MQKEEISLLKIQFIYASEAASSRPLNKETACLTQRHSRCALLNKNPKLDFKITILELIKHCILVYARICALFEQHWTKP